MALLYQPKASKSTLTRPPRRTMSLGMRYYAIWCLLLTCLPAANCFKGVSPPRPVRNDQRRYRQLGAVSSSRRGWYRETHKVSARNHKYPSTQDRRSLRGAAPIRSPMAWFVPRRLSRQCAFDSHGDGGGDEQLMAPLNRQDAGSLPSRPQLAIDSDRTLSKPTVSTHDSRRSFLHRATTAVTAAATSLFYGGGSKEIVGGIQPSNALTDDETKRIAIFEKVAPSVVFIDTFVERRDVFSPNVMEVPLGSGSGFVWDVKGHIVTNFHVVRNAQVAQVAIITNDPAAARKGLLPQAGTQVGSATTTITDGVIMPSSSSPTWPTGATTQPGKIVDMFGSGIPEGRATRFVFKATVVGVDPGKDIAVLKVDAPPSLLVPLAVGTSTGLKVGQQAIAIGNPFGLDHTLTAGIISGIGREVRSPIGRPINNVIQTDASINPGNSGGPLLDSSGKLIGMNTAIYSPSGASAGIGFAIPVDTVKYIAETLIRDGKIVRPIMGISYLESKQARALGITSGVLVLDVPDGSPAAKAGLKGTRRTETGLIEIGDIIVQVGDRNIDKESDLFQALEDYEPGDIARVTVNRIVAVNDEMQVQVVTLNILLQPSTVFEKNIPSVFAYPMPMR